MCWVCVSVHSIDGFCAHTSISSFQAGPNSKLNLLMPVWLSSDRLYGAVKLCKHPDPQHVMVRVNNSLWSGRKREKEAKRNYGWINMHKLKSQFSVFVRLHDQKCKIFLETKTERERKGDTLTWKQWEIWGSDFCCQLEVSLTFQLPLILPSLSPALYATTSQGAIQGVT